MERECLLGLGRRNWEPRPDYRVLGAGTVRRARVREHEGQVQTGPLHDDSWDPEGQRSSSEAREEDILGWKVVQDRYHLLEALVLAGVPERKGTAGDPGNKGIWADPETVEEQQGWDPCEEKSP
jgi:hypothetical protein